MLGSLLVTLLVVSGGLACDHGTPERTRGAARPPEAARPRVRPAPAPHRPATPRTDAAPARPPRDLGCDEVRMIAGPDGHPMPAPLEITRVYCTYHGDGCCIRGGLGVYQWGCNNARDQEWYMDACS